MDYLTDPRFLIGLAIGLALAWFWASKTKSQGGSSPA